MIVNLIYFGVGILFGIAIKYEIEQRMKKRKVAKKIHYLKSVAASSKVQDCDDVLATIRNINESLTSMNNSAKEGVR